RHPAPHSPPPGGARHGVARGRRDPRRRPARAQQAANRGVAEARGPPRDRAAGPGPGPAGRPAHLPPQPSPPQETLGQLLAPRRAVLLLAADHGAAPRARLCRGPRGGPPQGDEPRPALLEADRRADPRQRRGSARLAPPRRPRPPPLRVITIVEGSTR